MRCLLVDDSRSFLDAASILLEREGLDVCGTASTTAEALRETAELHPDVVLVDISLGSESGLDLARSLAGATPHPRVILISTHDEAEYVDLIDASSAIGFLAKIDLSAAAIRQMIAAIDGDQADES